MKYLVMETRLGYAIVMDDCGRFLKVVNFKYQVGQKVDKIVTFETEVLENNRKWKKQLAVFAMAACFCLAFLGVYRDYTTLYGTVRMQINPVIMMSVNQYDYVFHIEGLNEDGKELIEGYRYFAKQIDTVSDELADRAIEQGFLSEGGKIVIEASSDDEKWVADMQERLVIEVDMHLDNKMTVETRKKKESTDTIRIQPEKVSENNDDDGESSYSESSYGESSYNDSSYDDSSYDDSSYDDSSYGDSEYGDENEGTSGVTGVIGDRKEDNSDFEDETSDYENDDSDYSEGMTSSESDKSDYDD